MCVTYHAPWGGVETQSPADQNPDRLNRLRSCIAPTVRACACVCEARWSAVRPRVKSANVSTYCLTPPRKAKAVHQDSRYEKRSRVKSMARNRGLCCGRTRPTLPRTTQQPRPWRTAATCCAVRLLAASLRGSAQHRAALLTIVATPHEAASRARLPLRTARTAVHRACFSGASRVAGSLVMEYSDTKPPLLLLLHTRD
jgi:hypothetical protein